MNQLAERSEQAAAVYKQFFLPYKKTKQTTASRPKKGKTDVHNVNPAVQAIINHDAEYFRKVLNEPPRTFDNQEQFFYHIYHYPLDRFLQVNAGSAFCCYFHDDHNPSASVYQSTPDTGKMWLYHCYTENLTLNLKTLVEKAGDFQNEMDALDFIKAALNLKIVDTKNSRRQQKVLDLIVDKMLRTDTLSFATLCPTADSNLKYGKQLYLQILVLAKRTIYPSKAKNSPDVLFYMSTNELMQAADRGSRDKVTKWIKLFCYHHLLEAVPDQEIPPGLLQKAIRTANNPNKHVSFYRIPSLVIRRLEDVENRGKRWKENRYTLKGLSYELIYRTEGKAEADRLFPQRYAETVGNIATLGKEGNAAAEARHDMVHEIAVSLLEKQGYFTENQITEQCNSTVWGGIQVKRSIMDICNTYNLTRCKASKALKQRFNILGNGYPYVYYQA